VASSWRPGEPCTFSTHTRSPFSYRGLSIQTILPFDRTLMARRPHQVHQVYTSAGTQTARTATKRFSDGGLQEALRKHSSRPKEIRVAFDWGRAERLREMLHRSPREFGKGTSLWIRALASEASFEQGISEEQVTAETVRATLSRMGLRTRRWIISPDPQYARKKAPRPVDPSLGG